jgi:putative transposase
VAALSREEIDLRERLKARAQQTAHRDGSRRMSQQLQEAGAAGGRWTARRLLPQARVSVAGRRRRGPKTTESRPGEGGAPHLLARHVDGTAPKGAWCGEGTYIWTEAGGWYTSVLVELYARKGGDGR